MGSGLEAGRAYALGTSGPASPFVLLRSLRFLFCFCARSHDTVVDSSLSPRGRGSCRRHGCRKLYMDGSMGWRSEGGERDTVGHSVYVVARVLETVARMCVEVPGASFLLFVSYAESTLFQYCEGLFLRVCV